MGCMLRVPKAPSHNTHRHLAFVFGGKGYNRHPFPGEMTAVAPGIQRLQLQSALMETRHPEGNAPFRPLFRCNASAMHVKVNI